MGKLFHHLCWKKTKLNTAEDLKWQWYTWHATDGARHRPPFSFTSSSCSCCASGRKWPELQRLIGLCCCDERTWHSCWIQCDSTYLRPFLGFYQSATRSQVSSTAVWKGENHRGSSCDLTKCLRSFWHASIRIVILSVYMINFTTSWLHNNHKWSEPWTRPLTRPHWIQTVSDTMCWKAHLFIHTDCSSAQKEFLKDLCWVLFTFHHTWMRLWRSGVRYHCVIIKYPNSQGDEQLVSCF